MRCRLCRIAGILAATCLAAAVAWADYWIQVRWVDDGDTIVLADGRKIRYIGIDAPEIANEKYGKKAEPLGYEALRFNRQLVHRKRVLIELDAETHDAYNRMLAYVYLPGKRMVNEQMLANGFAYFLPHRPNGRYDALLLKAQQKAMQAEKGIWRQWRKTGGKVIGNRRSRRFHKVSCPNSGKISMRNRIVFENPWNAFWKGYAPAKRCHQ